MMGKPERGEKDYLWLHLRDLPYFRALVRAVEARFYEDIELPAPTLDLGCGDGHFASLAFERRLEVGLDPWSGPLRQAAKLGSYRALVHADGGQMPFPDGSFASVVSNSVLEHIPHLEVVLKEVSRVIQPGGAFVFCVPNHQFLEALSIARGFDRLGLRGFAMLYRSFFNRISRHQHCDPPEVWKKRLESNGFSLLHWWHYFPPQALRVVEWGHYFGLPALLCHWLFGRWIVSPTRWNLYFTRKLVEPYYRQDPLSDKGVYSFYIAKKNL
jgi:SAM-dependent methyltransferase